MFKVNWLCPGNSYNCTIIHVFACFRSHCVAMMYYAVFFFVLEPGTCVRMGAD